MKHETYNRWSLGLHWLMLLLFVLAYASIELRGIFEKGTAQRELMKSAHFSIGLAILALVWVRMIARMLTTTPPIVPAPMTPTLRIGRIGTSLPISGTLAVNRWAKNTWRCAALSRETSSSPNSSFSRARP